jgi:ABC-type antimicrobial peptide transport system permease subunit
MKFHKEYNYCFVGLLVVFLVYILFSFIVDVRLQLLISLFSIIVGSGMVVLGFWGSDFAFAMAIGHLDQSMEKGKVRGKKKKVYVPFMGNYTPLEWWNLNWFLTFMGVLLVALGTTLLGILFGVYVF